jgi:hypothetical protein
LAKPLRGPSAPRRNRLRAVVAVVALLIVQILRLPSAEAETLNVEQAVAIALQRNLDLLAARQELQTARARVVKAHYLNQFNPQAEGGASQVYFYHPPAAGRQ